MGGLIGTTLQRSHSANQLESESTGVLGSSTIVEEAEAAVEPVVVEEATVRAVVEVVAAVSTVRSMRVLEEGWRRCAKTAFWAKGSRGCGVGRVLFSGGGV